VVSGSGHIAQPRSLCFTLKHVLTVVQSAVAIVPVLFSFRGPQSLKPLSRLSLWLSINWHLGATVTWGSTQAIDLSAKLGKFIFGPESAISLTKGLVGLGLVTKFVPS
jgi:hypothetical protein